MVDIWDEGDHETVSLDGLVKSVGIGNVKGDGCGPRKARCEALSRRQGSACYWHSMRIWSLIIRARMFTNCDLILRISHEIFDTRTSYHSTPEH